MTRGGSNGGVRFSRQPELNRLGNHEQVDHNQSPEEDRLALPGCVEGKESGTLARILWVPVTK